MSTPVSIRALNWKQLLALLGIIVLLPVAMVLAIPALVGFLALIFILAPIGLIGVAFHNHRKRKVAKAFPCLRCDQLLGAKSVRLADKAFRKHLKELRHRYPFAKFRIRHSCHAICATCGMRYSYRPKERTFVPETGNA
jgi:hypothetical protein